MTRSFTALALIICFVAGALVSPAFAGSHPGSYGTIYGHSTSCALGRASTNDTSDRGGAFTANFEGCSSSAPRRTVPTAYLGARAYVVCESNGALCGASALKSNSAPASSVDASTPRTKYSDSCDTPGRFFGYSENFRDTDAGPVRKIERAAGSYYFDSSLI